MVLFDVVDTKTNPFSAVVKSESVRNIIRERRMLEHLNHPFLCNLRYSFQDIEYMCVDVYQPLPRSLVRC